MKKMLPRCTCLLHGCVVKRVSTPGVVLVRFYGESVRAYDILNGNVEAWGACSELYDVLTKHQEMFENRMKALAKKEARRGVQRGVDAASQNFTVRMLTAVP